MAKTNHLGSHHPERKSHPANKMIPKETLRLIRKVIKREVNGKIVYWGGAKRGCRWFKHFHTKKSRSYNKNVNNFSD